MDKTTKNILLISGAGVLVILLGCWIYNESKEAKGEGEVSSSTKDNKIVFTKNK